MNVHGRNRLKITSYLVCSLFTEFLLSKWFWFWQTGTQLLYDTVRQPQKLLTPGQSIRDVFIVQSHLCLTIHIPKYLTLQSMTNVCNVFPESCSEVSAASSSSLFLMTTTSHLSSVFLCNLHYYNHFLVSCKLKTVSTIDSYQVKNK